MPESHLVYLFFFSLVLTFIVELLVAFFSWQVNFPAANNTEKKVNDHEITSLYLVIRLYEGNQSIV